MTSFLRSLTVQGADTRLRRAGPVLVWRLRDDGSVASVALTRSSNWKPLDRQLLEKAKSLRFPGAAKCSVRILRVEFSPDLLDAVPKESPAPTGKPAGAK
jgi:hypothetical protein